METSSQIYVNPLTDAGFKALLCDPANKRDLIALLNAFLPAWRRVSDLEYATTEMPGVTLSNKASRVDLRCTGAEGGGVHRGGAAQPAAALLPPVRVLRVADIRPGVGAWRQAAL